MEKSAKIWIAGASGMVGSAIVRKLTAEGYNNLLTPASRTLDLRAQQAVLAFMASERPNYIFLAAAKVGGIHANNTYRAEFLYENLIIAANVIHAAYLNGVKKLLFLGSSCIYPKFAAQPIQESSLLTGALEPTNEPYAIAKIAGLKLCESYRLQYGCDFISAMPTNLYGPNDNYDLQNAHVLPALLRKFHLAKTQNAPRTTLWGDGTPRREFMHVDDLARACLLLMREYSAPEPINVGVGEDISIKELAEMVQATVGFKGEIVFDAAMPNGTRRKLLDVTRLKALGFVPQIALSEGIAREYETVDKSGW